MAKVVKSSLANLAVGVALFLPIGSPVQLYAQSSGETSKAASRANLVPPRLTSEQRRGLRLLKSAAGESTALPPEMHAFVLWRASYAYTKLDPKQADKLARDAFIKTHAIEDISDNDHCVIPGSAGDTKSWIQQNVLSNMVRKDQLQDVEQVLPQATVSVENEIAAELVRYYESKKDLPHAEAFLSKLADSNRYPYASAADLVTALGTEHSAERMSIFNQALDNFEQHATKTAFGTDDIGSFIDRIWKDIPPGLVLEAIGKVLEAAKEQGLHSQYSMSSAKGSVVFELRLRPAPVSTIADS
jgi:hypothetical protein